MKSIDHQYFMTLAKQNPTQLAPLVQCFEVADVFSFAKYSVSPQRRSQKQPPGLFMKSSFPV